MAPQRSPDAYGLQVVSPSGCTRVDCDLFIGIAINTGDNGFLDIYMEGTAAGWVAVGFSDTADMVSCWVGDSHQCMPYICCCCLTVSLLKEQ